MNKLIQFNQLWQLLLAHLKDLIREPAVLFWGIVFPILKDLGVYDELTTPSSTANDKTTKGANSTHIGNSFGIGFSP